MKWLVAEFIEELQKLPQDSELVFEVLDENGYSRSVNLDSIYTNDENKIVVLYE